MLGERLRTTRPIGIEVPRSTDYLWAMVITVWSLCRDVRAGMTRRSRGRDQGRWVLALASCLLVLASGPQLQAAETRSALTHDELMAPDGTVVDVVDNSWFLPVGESTAAVHRFEGTLTVPRAEMQRSSYAYAIQRNFPGFSVGFVSSDGYLIPINRSIIMNPGNWSLILSPGRVWSEPGDEGLSRASFPFTLASPPDRLFGGGEAHNGVATFLFDDTIVSSFRFQITQETAPDGNIYDMWGQLPMEYRPGTVDGAAEAAKDCADELAAQVPVVPWSYLEARADAEVLDSFTAGLAQGEISAAGLVIDGVLYLQPSRTRSGDYPYPQYMQHAGMSVSKSIGAGVSMLWLAEKYGEDVFDLRIADYLDITADHNGWDDVTFGDALNMATGVGDNSPEREPNDIYANESGPNYEDFYLGETTAEKLGAAFAAADYSWGPNEVVRYTSSQTFVLSAAMDAYLKTMEGPDADLWTTMTEEVFRPIGIHHMTMMEIPNDGGSTPLMSSGLRLTVDDVAKITTLLQNSGRHNGEQILHAARTNDALYRTGELAGLPTGKSFRDGDQAYHSSFWSIPHRTANGTYFQVPFMSGAGGITIFLTPNGVSTFVFTDSGQDTYSLNSPAVAEAIRAYPEPGLPNVSLTPNGFEALNIIVLASIALGLLATVALIAHHTHLRRQINPR